MVKADPIVRARRWLNDTLRNTPPFRNTNQGIVALREGVDRNGKPVEIKAHVILDDQALLTTVRAEAMVVDARSGVIRFQVSFKDSWPSFDESSLSDFKRFVRNALPQVTRAYLELVDEYAKG